MSEDQGGDSFDLCECVFSHEFAMRRLLNLVSIEPINKVHVVVICIKSNKVDRNFVMKNILTTLFSFFYDDDV